MNSIVVEKGRRGILPARCEKTGAAAGSWTSLRKRPVPIDQPDFRAAAQGPAEAGKAAYKAAQSKSMDEMVTVSETVAAACSKCHEPYRDFDDPKDRCQGV
jgi:cytochrome c556